MLAYQQARHERLERLAAEVFEQMPNEFGYLAQVLIRAMEM